MSNIQNREEFLNNLAEKLGRNRRKDRVIRPQWEYQPQWDVLAGYTADELVDVLENQCDSIHTNFMRTDSRRLNRDLLKVIKLYEGKTIMTWDDSRFTLFGLRDYFQTLRDDEGISVEQWDVKEGKKSIHLAEKAEDRKRVV